MHTFIGILLVVLFVGLLIWAIIGLDKSSRHVYTNLDAIWDKAKAAKTRDELRLIRTELCQFHNKYCVIRHYGDYARQVLSFIDGKLSGMS